MPAPPPQSQMVVPQLRTHNGSTSLGEKATNKKHVQCQPLASTGKVVEEFSATYRNLQLPVVHVSDWCKDYQDLYRFLLI